MEEEVCCFPKQCRVDHNSTVTMTTLLGLGFEFHPLTSVIAETDTNFETLEIMFYRKSHHNTRGVALFP